MTLWYNRSKKYVFSRSGENPNIIAVHNFWFAYFDQKSGGVASGTGLAETPLPLMWTQGAWFGRDAVPFNPLSLMPRADRIPMRTQFESTWGRSTQDVPTSVCGVAEAKYCIPCLEAKIF